MIEVITALLGIGVGLNVGLALWAWYLVKRTTALNETLEQRMQLQALAEQRVKGPFDYYTDRGITKYNGVAGTIPMPTPGTITYTV